MRLIVKPSDPSTPTLWIVCLACLFFPVNEATAQDGIDPAIREYGILYTVDGRKLWGRLAGFDGQTYKWQLPNDRVLRLPLRQVTRVLPIPLGVVPQSYVFRGEQRTILPLGQLSWADKVVGFAEGWPRQSLPGNNPRVALGAPDYQRDGDGKDVVLGHGGGLVVAFTDNALMDVPGPDLVIVEVGEKIEPTRVEISVDGKSWLKVGMAGGGPSVLLDIGRNRSIKPNQRFHFVRIVDAKFGLSNRSRWPGADIDAVGAIGSVAASYPYPEPNSLELDSYYQSSGSSLPTDGDEDSRPTNGSEIQR
jgi:hypothetical protein